MEFTRVVFGVRGWGSARPYHHVERAARGLAQAGFDVTVLDTEKNPSHPASPVPRDLRFRSIARAPYDHPADIWLSLIRYLEEHAPCVYLTNGDHMPAIVAPRLSNRVAIIGVLHEDSAAEYDHCARLAEFWNAVVVLDPVLRQRIIGEYPGFAARLGQIADNDTAATPEQLARNYSSLIGTVSAGIRSGEYRRKQKKMPKPPGHLVPDMSDRQLGWQVARVNAVPLWPDLPSPQVPVVRVPPSASLRDHRIVIAVPTGRVSGVDVFSINLARGLIARGYQAELVQTAPDAAVADRLPLPSDVPVSTLALKPFPTWRERWAAMRQHLEARGPCIYLPNYDTSHSCVIPQLSPRVKVVGIGHSDDAQHYAHILRLAPYWDAVVAVSPAVAETISDLAPGIEPRLSIIPYGVPVVDALPSRNTGRRPLAAVYTGRIVRFQKRAMDLLSIAEALRSADADVELTVAGSGSELPEFLAAAGSLLLSRHLRYVGGVTNEQVLDLVAESDVFILPSGFEGLPVSLLEAMANGCVPVLSAIRSGVPEVVQDGQNGFLVPIGGISDFADRIACLANDRELLARLRVNAHRTVRERYGIETMTSSYLEIFERVVDDPVARPQGPLLPPPHLHAIERIMPRFPMPLRRIFWGIRGKGN